MAVTKSGTTYSIFIDGKLAATETNPNPVPNAYAPLTIGQAEQIGFMNGLLDEVTIYNKAVSQAELQAIVNAGSAGKCKAFKIQPQTGGDIGTVTMRITGGGFTDGTTVNLAKSGASDIAGTSVNVQNGGTTLTASFDLAGKTQGLWDVMITYPDGSVKTLPSSFTIEEGEIPQIWVDIVGLNLIRIGRPQIFHVFYSNTGNVTGTAYLALRGVPKDADVKVNFGRVIDASTNDLRVNDEPAYIIDYENERMIPVDLRNISAGATGVISLQITLHTATPFTLQPMVMSP